MPPGLPGPYIPRLELAGRDLQIARQNGQLQWGTTYRPADSNDLVPAKLIVPFGPAGIGSSLPAVEGQINWARGINHERWDMLEPGPYRGKLGLALDSPVTALAMLRDGSAQRNPYLYVGAGQKTVKLGLRPIGANPGFTVYETKTFAVGASVTDIVVVKDGPGPNALTVQSQPGDCRAIVLFGNTAQIAQIDTVGTAAVDTWHTPSANAAFGGYGVPGPGSDNLTTKVWKSSPILIATNVGAYMAVQNAPVQDTTIDLTFYSTWVPATPYRVGDFGSSVTALLDLGGGLGVIKPEGLYAFNQANQPVKAMSFRASRDDATGRGAVAWGSEVYIPTGQDVMQYPASPSVTMGISTLLSNLSPIQGRPVALAPYGSQYLFIVYYSADTGDSWIVRAKERGYIQAPHDYLYFAVERISGVQVQTAEVVSDGVDSTYLFFSDVSDTPGKYDVGFLALQVGGHPQYTNGGEWYSGKIGSIGKPMRLLRVNTYGGPGCDGSNFYTIARQWDDSGIWEPVGTIDQIGPLRFGIETGVFDTGTLLELRITYGAAGPTGHPTLYAAGLDRTGPGGLELDVLKQPDYVLEFRAVVNVGEARSEPSGSIDTDPAQDIIAALRQLTSVGVLAVARYENEWIDGVTKEVIVQSVTELSGDQLHGYTPGQRMVEIKGIVASLNPG